MVNELSSASLFFASWGFAAVSLSNLTVSPHPVWLLAGVLARSAGRAFSGAFFFSYPLLQLQCAVSSLRASKAHGCRPSGKEGQRKREAEGGGKSEKEKEGERKREWTDRSEGRCAPSRKARESEGLHSSIQVRSHFLPLSFSSPAQDINTRQAKSLTQEEETFHLVICPCVPRPPLTRPNPVLYSPALEQRQRTLPAARRVKRLVSSQASDASLLIREQQTSCGGFQSCGVDYRLYSHVK